MTIARPFTCAPGEAPLLPLCRSFSFRHALALALQHPDALATYTNLLVEGRFAFLEGTADSGHTRVRDGADSFVMEDGWLVGPDHPLHIEPV